MDATLISRECSNTTRAGARRRLLLAVVMTLAPFFGKAADAAQIGILMLGTSLTQGYGLPPGTEIPVLLQGRLKAAGIDAKVINAGVSGDTSADALSRLDWSLADHPNAAVVELGSNDALRAIPPVQTKRNLSAILAKLKAQHIPTLILGMKAPRNLGPEYARAFDSIFPDLAKQYRVALYPFLLDGVVMNPKLNQADGMHPNPAGAKIIVDRLFPDVKALVQQAQHALKKGH